MSERTLLAGPLGPAFFWKFAACLSLLYGGATAQAQALKLPLAQLRIADHIVHAEVAATEAARNYGLMHREALAPDHGMLFVFDTPHGRPCFWMKNTPLPLSIAFISHDGVIINTADMTPYSEASHCPAAPALYALEMQQGWFSDRGIRAGQRVEALPGPAN